MMRERRSSLDTHYSVREYHSLKNQLASVVVAAGSRPGLASTGRPNLSHTPPTLPEAFTDDSETTTRHVGTGFMRPIEAVHPLTGLFADLCCVVSRSKKKGEGGRGAAWPAVD